MINRNNWKAMKAFLQYRLEVDQVSIASIRLDECCLRHLLLWADDKSFSSVEKVRPSFAEYLRSARLDSKDKPLSPAYAKKVVTAAKYFLRWLHTHRHGSAPSARPGWSRSNRLGN